MRFFVYSLEQKSLKLEQDLRGIKRMKTQVFKKEAYIDNKETKRNKKDVNGYREDRVSIAPASEDCLCLLSCLPSSQLQHIQTDPLSKHIICNATLDSSFSPPSSHSLLPSHSLSLSLSLFILLPHLIPWKSLEQSMAEGGLRG